MAYSPLYCITVHSLSCLNEKKLYDMVMNYLLKSIYKAIFQPQRYYVMLHFHSKFISVSMNYLFEDQSLFFVNSFMHRFGK